MHSNVRFMLRKFDATMLSCSGGIRVSPSERGCPQGGGVFQSSSAQRHKSFETNQLINSFINQFNSL